MMRLPSLPEGAWLPLACVMWALALACCLWAVHTRHRARELFVELEQLNRQRDVLDIEWGQLQLEQSTWSSHAWVEQVAVERLRMAQPRPVDIQVMRP
ncbi:MAG: hypothetical protein RL026_502 [Pseudomonadota bacterium]|jgi:cell division protein FtsL